MILSAYIKVSGLGDVGYSFYDYSETIIGSRVTTDIVDAGGGWYSTDTASIPALAASVRWDSTGNSSAIAREYFYEWDQNAYNRIGVAQAGALSTITLDTGASASDDFYNNAIILLTGGTGAGQSRIIADYVGSTRVASVNGNWVTNPASGTEFLILPLGAIPGATAPTAIEVADEVQTRTIAGVTTAGAVSGNVAGNVVGSVGSLAAQAKLDVNAEADTALADVGLTGVVTGRIDTTVSSRLAASAITLTGGKVTVGTNDDKTGYALSAAGIQALWDALTSALTTVGSIGKKLADWALGSDNRVLVSANAHTSGQTAVALTGNVGGNVVGNVNGNVGGNVVGSIGSLAAQAKLDVNAEVDIALADYDGPTFAEMVARTIPSADYATSAIVAAIKAKTDLLVDPVRINTSTDGSLNSVTLDAGASSVNNFYQYCLLVITAGTGAGQSRFISSYNGTSKIATVSNDFAVAVAAGASFTILQFANVLSGPAWAVLLASVSSGGGSGSSQFGGQFVGADQSRNFTQVPGGLDCVGVVGNDLFMDILFEGVDLTGCTFSGYVVLEPAPLQKTYPLTIDPVNLAGGMIRMSLSDADTTAIGPVANKPWVIAWDNAGEQRNLVMGRFQLNRF